MGEEDNSENIYDINNPANPNNIANLGKTAKAKTTRAKKVAEVVADGADEGAVVAKKKRTKKVVAKQETPIGIANIVEPNIEPVANVINNELQYLNNIVDVVGDGVEVVDIMKSAENKGWKAIPKPNRLFQQIENPVEEHIDPASDFDITDPKLIAEQQAIMALFEKNSNGNKIIEQAGNIIDEVSDMKPINIDSITSDKKNVEPVVEPIIEPVVEPVNDEPVVEPVNAEPLNIKPVKVETVETLVNKVIKKKAVVASKAIDTKKVVKEMPDNIAPNTTANTKEVKTVVKKKAVVSNKTADKANLSKDNLTEKVTKKKVVKKTLDV